MTCTTAVHIYFKNTQIIKFRFSSLISSIPNRNFFSGDRSSVHLKAITNYKV